MCVYNGFIKNLQTIQAGGWRKALRLNFVVDFSCSASNRHFSGKNIVDVFLLPFNRFEF